MFATTTGYILDRAGVEAGQPGARKENPGTPK